MLINYFRRVASKPFIAIILVTFIFSISITSCQKSGDIQEPKTTSFSGEQMFRGIFFMQGDFAKNIDSFQPALLQINNSSQKNINYRDDVANDIVNGIKKIDPSFFQKFESDLKSNNLFKIKESLYSAGQLAEVVGINSAKYGKSFSLAKKMTDKVDISSYNLENPVDVSRLKKDIKSLEPSGSFNLEDDTDTELVAITFAVAVAAVIWEVAAAVNAAVMVNVWGYVNVRTVMNASTRVRLGEESVNNPTARTANDLFILNISDVANGRY